MDVDVDVDGGEVRARPKVSRSLRDRQVFLASDPPNCNFWPDNFFA